MSRPAAVRARRIAITAGTAVVSVVVAVVLAVGVEHGVGRSAPPSQELVSLDAGGAGPAPGTDRAPSVSADGSIVVYTGTPAGGGLPLAAVRDRARATTTPVPLPAGAGRQEGAVLSADGCSIAFWSLTTPAGGAAAYGLYAWDRCTGGAPVAVLPASAPLVLPATAQVSRPALSRDGRFVAYAAATARGAPQHIAVVDRTSGMERSLSAAPVLSLTTVDIAADGSTVVFDAGTDPAAAPSSVLAWTPATDVVRPVSVGPGGGLAGGINAMPSVSADGRLVAFVSNSADIAGLTAGTLQLYVGDLTAGTTKLVTATPGSAQAGNVVQPDLTADGLQVAFTLQAPGAPVNLAVPVAGPSSVVVARSLSGVFATAAVETISTGAAGAAAAGTSAAPVLSATGRFTAYESDAGTTLSGNPRFPAGFDAWLAQRLPALSVAATTDLGTADVGTPSAPVTVTVSNPSSVGVTVRPVAPPGNGFAVVADTCSNAIVPAGTTCSVTIVFTPASAAAASAVLTISGEDQTATTTLRGSGREARGELAIDNATVQFPSTAVGARGGPIGVTVRNVGGLPVGIAGAALEGDAADQFSVVGDGCAGQTLDPGATCQVNVAVLPTAAGTLRAALVVSGNDGESASATLRVVAFRSTVTTPPPTPPQPAAQPGRLSAAPTTITFPSTQIGALSPPARVEVSNAGGSAVAIDRATIIGGGGQFAVDDDTCSGELLAPGRTCTVSIVVQPVSGGEPTATLTIEGIRGETTSVALAMASSFAPALSVAPGVVKPGRLTTVTGTNFPPGQSVELRLSLAGGAGVALPFGTATSDETGAFVAGIVVPQHVVAGAWQVVVVAQPDFTAGSARLLVDRSGASPGDPSGPPGISRPGPRVPSRIGAGG